jgi:hypothetical protein
VDELGAWEQVTDDVQRAVMLDRERTWLYAMHRGERWVTMPVTFEAAEEPGITDWVARKMRMVLNAS